MNSTAWETTTQDISTVLERWDITKGEGELERLLDRLDHDEIEKSALSALYGDDLDDQINYAYGEIELQLVQMGVLPNTDVRHFD